jgi:hypothetical protein
MMRNFQILGTPKVSSYFDAIADEKTAHNKHVSPFSHSSTP